MARDDAVVESTQNSTRSTHRMNSNTNNNGTSKLHNHNTHSRSFSHFFAGSSHRTNRSSSFRSRGGHLLVRNRGHGRIPLSYGPYTSPNPCDVVDEFDDLNHLSEDDEEGIDSMDTGVINPDAYEDIPVEVSGSDVPKPAGSFEEIDLEESLKVNIKYDKPTPVQQRAIPIAMAGRDLMACAYTGSGKTAAFCVPIISQTLKLKESLKQDGYDSDDGSDILAFPSALILSPTRELSCQIHKEAMKFASKTGVKVVVVYGGSHISRQMSKLAKGVDILVATPGRLIDMIQRERVSLEMIKYLAIDEADRMLDLGFEPQIRTIAQQMNMPPPGTRQTMLFSATFPDDIQRLAADFLSDYIFVTIGKVGSSTELIEQRVEFVEDVKKRDRLLEILLAQDVSDAYGKPPLTLVFVGTKKGAGALESWLSKNGLPAIAIHGNKSQQGRDRALKSFRTHASPILVATDIASRGLDIPNVAHVINFDFPKDMDHYVHRIGRTGRAGKSGLATTFFNDKNMPLAKPLVELMQDSNQQVPPWLKDYAANSSPSVSSKSSSSLTDSRTNEDQSMSEIYDHRKAILLLWTLMLVLHATSSAPGR